MAKAWCITDINVKMKDHEEVYIVGYLGFEREAYIAHLSLYLSFFV
jgi:hypothetical protein